MTTKHPHGDYIMAEKFNIQVKVNGESFQREVEPRMLLGDFLREQLRLTGTHFGCEHGVCGACTVLVNGETVRSCLMFAVQADGAEITTVEGIGTAERMHPLQQAFWDNHGLQCGFCTPGILMTSLELLKSNPQPNEQEVRLALSGNICRCTGYQNIVTSILDAAKRMRAGGHA
jgi:aerobic-type carbon monoxide dehydrogenase small subunit (CoxS/CutS family)